MFSDDIKPIRFSKITFGDVQVVNIVPERIHKEEQSFTLQVCPQVSKNLNLVTSPDLG